MNYKGKKDEMESASPIGDALLVLIQGNVAASTKVILVAAYSIH